jgi:hypothetical protein
MSGEILFQNLFNLFIIAIIVESSVMALFSMSALQSLNDNVAVKSLRDGLILITALAICYLIPKLWLFSKTGLVVPKFLNIAISGLVLARMTAIVSNFFARMKNQ